MVTLKGQHQHFSFLLVANTKHSERTVSKQAQNKLLILLLQASISIHISHRSQLQFNDLFKFFYPIKLFWWWQQIWHCVQRHCVQWDYFMKEDILWSSVHRTYSPGMVNKWYIAWCHNQEDTTWIFTTKKISSLKNNGECDDDYDNNND
jgi:hypothetical protein